MVDDQARAERIAEQAFASVLTTRGGEAEIEARLGAAIWELTGHRRGVPISELPPTNLRVSRDLHLRILDAVEDRQYTTRPARSRLIALGAALLIVVVAGVVQLQRARSDALAGSLPTIADSAPAAGAVEVPLDGQFRVQFGRRPVGTPTIAHLPADGKQSAAHWDGSTLVVDYAGLHFGSTYQLVLNARYSSPLRDTGRFEKQWSFTAEGAPHLVTTLPLDGAAMVPREGLLTVEFSKRPTIEPVVTLSPPASLNPGFWNGSTWKVQYSGLQPVTRYTVAVTLLPADPKGHIHSTWIFDTEPGAPPAGVPVVWYSTTSHSDPGYLGVRNRLVAIDWTGRIVGTLYASVSTQSADGSWFFAEEGNRAMNARGQLIGPGLGNALWSDVSGRFCRVAFSSSTGRSWLEAGAAGLTTRVVAQLGSGGGAPDPIACSGASDRVVVADQGMTGTTDVRIFALSTGQLIYRRHYGDANLRVVSSRDGQYLAEGGTGTIQPVPTVIRRISDNAIVARLGARRVVAFSWDNSLVLTAAAWGVSGPADVQLLNWRTGAVLWRLAGDPQASGQSIYAIAQPGGSSFIVGLANPSGPGDVDGLFLVHADGQAQKIVVGSVFLAAYPD